jgi:hypothetical protein
MIVTFLVAPDTRLARLSVCSSIERVPVKAQYCFGTPSPFHARTNGFSLSPSPPASTIDQVFMASPSGLSPVGMRGRAIGYA